MQRFIIFLLLATLILAGCSPANPGTSQTGNTETQALSPTAQSGVPTATNAPAATDVPATQPATQTQEPAQPTEAAAPQDNQSQIVYTGTDGNIWVLDPVSGEGQQITQDAVPFLPGQPPPEEQISYCCAQWSSDGSLLAYRRDAGTAIESGYQYLIELWVYAPEGQDSRMLVQAENIPGFAWKPMSHLISYALPIPTEYFMNRSQQPQLATGLWAVEADTGNTYQLVAPERGLALVNPQWSPDGRFLSFDEVTAMEGRGYFAYYDFEKQEYQSWEEAIGQYDWSPDSETITYDELTYIATGGERIWTRDRQSGEERPLSPDYQPGYAFHPRFSPQGDQLAYLARLGGPETEPVTLFVVNVQGGEPRNLGEFEQTYELTWSPDGTRLALSSGPYEHPQVVEVQVADGTSTVLAEGREPAWRTTDFDH
jgi:Tol biopolymer transport system component